MSTKKLFWLAPAILAASCAGGGSNYDSYPSPASANESSVQTDSTVNSAGVPLNSPGRKVIRTADFRCKVKNVFTATTNLEHIVKGVGGIVQDSRIENVTSDTHSSYYTEDSLRQTQTYTTTATLTLRVPVQYLDSVLDAIPGMTSFIEARTVKQNDVTYRYMANELKNRVGSDSKATPRAMELAKKSEEPIVVQAYKDDREEKRIDRRLENLQLVDDVTYATVTVALAQPEQVYSQVVIDPSYYNNIPFALKCRQALFSGWSFFKGFFISLINIWPLIILGTIVWIVVRRIKFGRYAIVRK